MVTARGGWSITRYALYRAVLTMLIILVVLTVLCLFWVEPGQPAFYLCVLTLAVDLPVMAFIVVKLIMAYRKSERLDAKTYHLPDKKKKR